MTENTCQSLKSGLIPCYMLDCFLKNATWVTVTITTGAPEPPSPLSKARGWQYGGGPAHLQWRLMNHLVEVLLYRRWYPPAGRHAYLPARITTSHALTRMGGT
jgi:hypothetical protein